MRSIQHSLEGNARTKAAQPKQKIQTTKDAEYREKDGARKKSSRLVKFALTLIHCASRAGYTQRKGQLRRALVSLSFKPASEEVRVKKSLGNPMNQRNARDVQTCGPGSFGMKKHILPR